MNIKAIVFDKDGTLIDYSKFWYPVARVATESVCEKFGIPKDGIDEHIASLGVTEEKTDIKGSLPRGAHVELFTSICRWALLNGANGTKEDILSFAIKAYGEISKPYGRVEPACEDLRGVISSMKARGIYIALITSDEIVGAKIALEKLGVCDLFDEIIAHDGKSPAKPDPYYMNEFMQKHGFSADEVLMVGDTETDILFAKNSKTHSVGVGKEMSNREYLASFGAEAVFPDVSYLPEYIFK